MPAKLSGVPPLAGLADHQRSVRPAPLMALYNAINAAATFIATITTSPALRHRWLRGSDGRGFSWSERCCRIAASVSGEASFREVRLELLASRPENRVVRAVRPSSFVIARGNHAATGETLVAASAPTWWRRRHLPDAAYDAVGHTPSEQAN